LALVPLLAWLFGKAGRPVSLKYSSAMLLAQIGRAPKFGPGRILGTGRWLILILVIVALAEPRKERGENDQQQFGIDVVLLCDISPSMDLKDFMVAGRPVRRLEALAKAVGDFVLTRPNDRTAMVAFAQNPTIVCPLTLNASWLAKVVTQLPTSGGTAIGEGIYAATDLLKESKEKSKVIVLMTDGANSGGRPPLEAAQYAAKNHIRIYGVAISDFSTLTNPQNGDMLEMERCVNVTGGQLFKAADTSTLLRVYREIDRLEKHRLEQKQQRLYAQIFPWFLLPALVLALLEMTLSHTRYLRVP
jgi:Ca-activated chloride channel family protein